MKNKKKLLYVASALTLCLSLLLSSCDKLSLSKVRKDPTGSVLDGAIKTGEDIVFSTEGLEKILCSDKNHLSVSIDNSVTGSLTSDTYIDKKAGSLASTLNYKPQSENPLDLGIYYDGSSLAARSDGILGGTYGISLKTLKTDLEGSGLWSLMGTDYDSFNEEFGEAVDSFLKLFSEDGVISDFRNQSDGLKSDVIKLLNDTKPEVKTEKISLSGAETTAITVIYKLDTATVKAIARTFSEYYDGMLTDGALGEFLGIIENVSGEPALFGSDDTNEQIIDIFDEAEIDGTLSVSLSPKNAEIIAASADLDITDSNGKTGNLTASLALGENPSESGEKTLDIVIKGEGTDASVKVIFTSGETDDSIVRKINISADSAVSGMLDEITADIDFSLSKKDGGFKLAVSAPDIDDINISGTIKTEKNSVSLSVGSIMSGDAEVIDNLGLKITLSSGESVPAMPEYTNIASMDEKALTDLVQKIDEGIQSCESIFGAGNGLISDSYGSLVDDASDPEADSSDVDAMLGELMGVIENYTDTYDYDGDGDNGDADDYSAWEQVSELISPDGVRLPDDDFE